jgi:NAD(P)-dependent dehydrogenase (short-subunit alcohol dehydrogenase family)
MSSDQPPVAVVTGAGSGIGRATALRFSADGYTVIACGRRAEPLQDTKTAAENLSGQVIVCTGDVGLQEDAERITRTAVEAGDYRVLVNNAGVGWNYGVSHPGSMSALRDTSAEQWREVMRINLDSVYFMCHAALQHMRAGATIVNVASGGGLRGMDDAHTYATTKAGMINLTRSLARAYGPEGIRSNVVAPGFVDTDMVSSVLESDMNPFADETLRYQVSPLGRPGQPEEVAEAIYFMAVLGTYCNGAILSVDGGSLA